VGLRCSIGVMLQQDFTEDWDSVGGEGEWYNVSDKKMSL